MSNIVYEDDDDAYSIALLPSPIYNNNRRLSQSNTNEVVNIVKANYDYNDENEKHIHNHNDSNNDSNNDNNSDEDEDEEEDYNFDSSDDEAIERIMNQQIQKKRRKNKKMLLALAKTKTKTKKKKKKKSDDRTTNIIRRHNHNQLSNNNINNNNNNNNNKRKLCEEDEEDKRVHHSSQEIIKDENENSKEDEIRLSFIIRKSKKLQERKKLISRVIERRETKRSLERSSHNERPATKSPKATRYNINDALTIQKSIHQVIKEHAHASFTDNNSSLHETSMGRGNLTGNQIQSLIEENKTLKTKLVTRDAQTSLLDQHVNDLTGETKTLRKQLSRWQRKADKLSKLQNKERKKFDRSTDLIAEARVGLTKALNEGSKLRAKIHDLDSNIDERDRRLENLYDTIERQSDTIEELNIKLRDSLTVFQLNENEKRKLEDEVAVLISSKDGGDIGVTLRRLEQERQTWLWEREKKLEKAQIELEDENERMLKREKSRHQQELEIMTEETNKKKAIDINDQIMQGFINQQLDGMKEANRVLQAKLTSKREELTSEIKEQDDTIIELENQVHDLQKMVSNQDQSSKELVFRKAEVESVKEDLRDVRRQNKFLEKEMAKLNKRREDFGIQANGSQDEASFGNGGKKTKKVKQARRTSTKSLDQFLDSRIEKFKERKKNKEKYRKGPKLKPEKKPPTKKKKKKNTKKGKDRKKSKKRCKSKKTKMKTSPDVDDSSSMIVFKQVHRDSKYNDTSFNDNIKREKKSKKKSKTTKKSKSKLKRTIDPDKDDSSMIVFKQKHRRSKKHNDTASSDGEQGRSEPPTSILCTPLQ